MRMPDHIRAAIDQRYAGARDALSASGSGSNANRAWDLLGEAHILSQPWVVAHTKSHLHMLAMAVRLRMVREVLGQLSRLGVAGVGSALGAIPVGNHGRSTISAVEPIPLRPELAELLEGYLPRRARLPMPLVADS